MRKHLNFVAGVGVVLAVIFQIAAIVEPFAFSISDIPHTGRQAHSGCLHIGATHSRGVAAENPQKLQASD